MYICNVYSIFAMCMYIYFLYVYVCIRMYAYTYIHMYIFKSVFICIYLQFFCNTDTQSKSWGSELPTQLLAARQSG